MNKEPAHRVAQESADCYAIRSTNSLDSARIFIQENVRDSGEHWGYISVVSSFGCFGHCFSNTGPRTLKEFLLTVGYDYLMGKLFGLESRLFDSAATHRALSGWLKQTRREGAISKEDARDIRLCLDKLEEESCTDSNLFMHTFATSAGRFFHEFELWTLAQTRPNPQAQGFWDEIWPGFTKALRAELQGSTRKAA